MLFPKSLHHNIRVYFLFLFFIIKKIILLKPNLPINVVRLGNVASLLGDNDLEGGATDDYYWTRQVHKIPRQNKYTRYLDKTSIQDH